MSSRTPMARAEWALVAVLFLAAFAAVVITANDYGITYDEPHYASAGVRYAAWWVNAFSHPGKALTRSAITSTWRLNHEHPPLQKVVAGLVARWLGHRLLGLQAIRSPSALWFALAVCGVYLWCRTICGWRGALFAALTLASMPRVVAHAHFLALDMPIMAWFFITAALTAEALRRNSWPWTVGAGLAFGLALLAKVNAFFLPLLLVPYALLWRRPRWPKLVAILVIGPAVFFAGWPWLWVAPIAHVKGYLAFHFRHAAYNIWYLGKLYQYAPWHYPFVMTAVTTPTPLLLLALGGLAWCWPRRVVPPERAVAVLALAVALLPSALPTSPKYNGVRLFLPAFPFLASLAGAGFEWLQTSLSRWSALHRGVGERGAALLPLLLGLALLLPGVQGVTATHPYQLAYYNALVGGTAGATQRGFETIYWGQVTSEAADFVNAIQQPQPRLLVIPKGVISMFEIAGARSDAQFTADESQAGRVDYVLFQCMQSDFTELCWTLYREAKPAYAVMLGDVPLFVAYDRAAVARVWPPRMAAAQAARAASAASEMNTPTR